MERHPDRWQRDPDRLEEEARLRERARRRLVEERIQEAMARGDFDNLPGYGKPLDLSENPFLKPEWRMPYKLLQDAGFAPDWIELDKEVRGLREDLAALRDRHVDWLRRQAETSPVAAAHARTRAAYARGITQLNAKIDQLNLMVPQVELQRRRVDMDAALARFDAAAREAFPDLPDTPVD